jgi:hypothetical protein
MIKRFLEKILNEYFLNFSSKQLKFGLLKGLIEISNLYINCDKINEILQFENIPLKLKFGLLSKLSINISFLNFQLDQFEIKDLIIVVVPAPEFASTVNDKRFLIGNDPAQVEYDKQHMDNVITHLLNNMAKLFKGKSMSKVSKVSHRRCQVL